LVNQRNEQLAGVLQVQGQGGAVQVDPMNPMLKPPGTKHLKLKYDILLSTFAIKFNKRRYIKPNYNRITGL
jgi:hypothetical protein